MQIKTKIKKKNLRIIMSMIPTEKEVILSQENILEDRRFQEPSQDFFEPREFVGKRKFVLVRRDFCFIHEV